MLLWFEVLSLASCAAAIGVFSVPNVADTGLGELAFTRGGRSRRSMELLQDEGRFAARCVRRRRFLGFRLRE